MLSALPVAISPLSYASVATAAWRTRGQLHVTAVVKATFALVPEGRMTLLAPDPIVHDEVPDPSGVGLRAAGDLVPRLDQADVLLTGHAEVPPRFSAPALRIWLGMVRDGVVKVDRALELDASRRVGQAQAHVHIHGAGPMSRTWPRRSQLLGAIDPRRLQGPLVDIPDKLDWSYFQAAPTEQRMDLLRGDEWLVLGGIFAGRPRLRTQLPEARAVACVYRRSTSPPRRGEPLQLFADTLQIDADRRCASISWRGSTPVHESELGTLHVVAGVEMPGRPVVWADPFPPDVAGPPAPAVSPAPTAPAAPAPVRSTPAAPAADKAVPPREANPLEGTYTLPDDMLLQLAAKAPTPFHEGSNLHAGEDGRTSSPRAENTALEKPAVETSPVSPPLERNPLEGTFQATDDAALLLKASPATPFQASRKPDPPMEAPREPLTPKPMPPPELNPLAGTFQLPNDSGPGPGEAPVTPFQAPSGSSGKIPSILSLALSMQARKRQPPAPRKEEAPVPREANPLAGTFVLPDDFAPLAAPVTPFEQLDRSEREAIIQMKLGDVFLAAMAAAGEAA